MLSLFALIGSHIFALAGLDLSPLIHASCIAGITGACHCAQLIGLDGGVSLSFLPGLALKHDPPDLYLPSDWDDKCKPPHPACADTLYMSYTSTKLFFKKKSNSSFQLG